MIENGVISNRGSTGPIAAESSMKAKRWMRPNEELELCGEKTTTKN